MGNNSNDYIITKAGASDADLEGYQLCFEQNGMAKDAAYLKWLHQNNLANAHAIYYAMHGGDIAAIYTAIPLILRVKGNNVKALQSVDTLTDAAHRGKGLFPKLANKLYEDAAANGYELVYGFPNENSAPGFFNKLQWVSFGEAPFLIKPLRISYFLKKIFRKKGQSILVSEEINYTAPLAKQITKDIFIKPISLFEKDYDLLWKKVSGNIGVCVDRPSSYMNWRYVNKPCSNYLKYGIYINGELTGAIVFTIKDKHNGRIGYLMELIYDETNFNSGYLLLQFATKFFRAEKADAVLAWSFKHSFNYKAYMKAGYYNLPERWRPQHLFLGMRPFNIINKDFVSNPHNWYISYSDSDTV